jgi:hypothetical protein
MEQFLSKKEQLGEQKEAKRQLVMPIFLAYFLYLIS